jgi:putative ABC transport system permease protein
MFRNYLITALRNLRKYKGFSFINLLGLAIGMACCILILLYVRDELSYDRYHTNADRIYRVTREWINEDGTSSLHLGHVAPPIAPLLLNDFPDIQEAVRIQTPDRMLCSHEDKHFLEEDIIFAEENFFSIFSFELLAGDPSTALRDPFTLVITEATARKYFGDKDPLGETLKFENRIDAKVTGIVRAAPPNSHFHFEIIGSLASLKQMYGQREFENWGSNNYATYLLLPSGYDIGLLKSQVPAFLDRHQGEDYHRSNTLHFQRLTDIHLKSHLDSEIEPNSNIVYIYIFSAIALFVLLIACINFMNLSTARSSIRAREVGMRKVVGAQRSHLIRQFLSESIVLAFFALVLAVVMVSIVLPAFGRFVERDLSPGFVQSPELFLGLLLIALLVGLVAGSYPAFILSSLRPVQVLKGTRGPAGRGSLFRTILVVSQFAISIILIISVAVVYQQLRYSRSKSLGFNREQVVVLPTSDLIRQRFDAIRTQLLAQPGVVSVAAARRVPSGRLLDSSDAQVISGDGAQPVNFRIAFVRVSHDFIPTFQMEMAAGRNFSREFPTDLKEAFILNEAAVSKMGWTAEEALGRSFGYGSRTGKIIGVVRDFHFESLHQEIAPIVFYLQPDYRNVIVRIRPDNIPTTMGFLKERWAELRPNYPFDYFFIDENFDSLYRTEEKLGQVFGVFSLLAIFIACLGLFGLASFTAERRIKEIGIRKVLGAPVGNIVILLSRDFTKWVLAANLIAWPIAYYAMHSWLQNFAYRTDIPIVLFLMAGALAFAIALLTVSYQTIRAALGNPSDALRYE